jgi:hypothetical protein
MRSGDIGPLSVRVGDRHRRARGCSNLDQSRPRATVPLDSHPHGHTTEERDGMLHSGMEGGLNESYAALDKLLARLA